MTPDYIFGLRFKLGKHRVSIRAWENNKYFGTNHTQLDLELKCDGKVIFPRGSMWIGVPGHQAIDSWQAKEQATSTFCYKPGDTDADFFKDYTPEQLDFVNSLGEELLLEKMSRWEEQ